MGFNHCRICGAACLPGHTTLRLVLPLGAWSQLLAGVLCQAGCTALNLTMSRPDLFLLLGVHELFHTLLLHVFFDYAFCRWVSLSQTHL